MGKKSGAIENDGTHGGMSLLEIKSTTLNHQSHLKSQQQAFMRGTKLEIFHDASVHGLLETWVLTSKIASIAGGAGATFTGLGEIAQCSIHGSCVEGLAVARQKDDLAVGRLGHSLHSLEVADLHGWRRTQDVGGLAHQLGGFDLKKASLLVTLLQHSSHA